MFSYMVDFDASGAKAGIECTKYWEIEAEGRNLLDLLYHYLDELLFAFLTDLHCVRHCEIISGPILSEDQLAGYSGNLFRDDMGEMNEGLEGDGDPDAEKIFKVRVRCYGEKFDLQKHQQGTEVKAITMHEMRINLKNDPMDIYVLVDI